jgi:hypothetical protein
MPKFPHNMYAFPYVAMLMIMMDMGKSWWLTIDGRIDPMVWTSLGEIIRKEYCDLFLNWK